MFGVSQISLGDRTIQSPKNAAIAQLGERKTEDLKVTGSIYFNM